MNRQALAELLRGWMNGAGFGTQKEFAAAISRVYPIDTGSLSRLLSGGDRVRISKRLIEAIAEVCEVDPTPGLVLADYVVGAPDLNIPEALLGLLQTMEPWELQLLAEYVPVWREGVRRLRDEVRHLPVDVLPTANETGDYLKGRAPWVTGKTAVKAGSGGRERGKTGR
jgi:hypothetical protein